MKRFILFIILSTHLFAITGYVRLSGPSICMDNCSIYFLENENGEFLSWITYLDSIEILDFYNDRFVDVIYLMLNRCLFFVHFQMVLIH